MAEPWTPRWLRPKRSLLRRVRMDVLRCKWRLEIPAGYLLEAAMIDAQDGSVFTPEKLRSWLDSPPKVRE